MGYAFRKSPSVRTAGRDEWFQSALDQPLSEGAAWLDSTKGGALSSFGLLGTGIRDFMIPRGNDPEPGAAQTALRNLPLVGPLVGGYESARRKFGADETPQPSLSEDAYKASPYFRADIPWDAGMTEARASALASWYDARRLREYYGQKRPIINFLGMLAGQALDPINYIPSAGPFVKGAAIARLGIVGGIAATSSIDAAANTALFGLATSPTRRSYGDDVSFQTTVTQIATAALIGGAFGAVFGTVAARSAGRAAKARIEAEAALTTLRQTQEARIVLNEAIDGLANDGDVKLSPNAVAPLAREAGRVSGDASVEVDASIGGASATATSTGRTMPVLFHGTAQARDKIIAPAGLDEYGPGAYLTTVNEQAQRYAKRDATDGKGVVYQVEVKAEPDQFVKWDVPLTDRWQTPRVMAELRRIYGEDIPKSADQLFGRKLGSKVPELKASQEIVGVEFRDMSIGTPGQLLRTYGRRGYTVWREELLSIKEDDKITIGGMTPVTLTAAERKAIGEYTYSGYGAINSYLRGTGQKLYTEAGLRQYIANLDAAIAKGRISSPMTVFRKENADFDIVNGLRIGDTWTPRSFTSVSTREGTARGRPGDETNSVVLRIKMPAGTTALDIEPGTHPLVTYPGQAEILLPRNTVFRKTGQEGNVIDLEVVTPVSMAPQRAMPAAIDTTPARPDPPPDGIDSAEARVGHPDDYKSLAEQYGVDPETGAFHEEGAIAQLEAEGRLSEADQAELDDGARTFEIGNAYARALKAAVSCVV